ncbi:hypothetical protein CVIRNUC_003886 [Coccomyxa viridis]|uniref:DUF1995 domain-containing protein n=1 Tax=Coccomyxa viridis TaxID=1274662 RepID=A0AAV1I1E5_9CHLO|nr:hypothetical protein CVIRNUC_003886 [Coccomyxa viridis]
MQMYPKDLTASSWTMNGSFKPACPATSLACWPPFREHAPGCRGISRRTRLSSTRADSETQPAPVVIPQRLNNTPMLRDHRRFFYDDACAAVKKAIQGKERLMSVKMTIPETNPEMDVYRIGTVLELVRDMATDLVSDGARVKVCVQQALGQGVFQGLPLSLSGVRRIMDNMDWGDALDFVSFGHVNPDQLDDADFYILVAPQNVVGSPIIHNLTKMAEAALQQGKTLILFNPLLRDVASPDGVMGVRGRKERMAFAASFTAAYHFRLLYASSATMYPIRGALRHVYGGPWDVFQRVDVGRREEEYQLIGSFDEEPDGSKLTPLFSGQRQGVSKPWWQL